MNQYITIFVALAIIIGVGTFVISTSYDSISLPSGSETIPAVPAVTVPLPDEVTGLKVWLDADDGDTISIGVGVSQWDDKSGQANHVTQGVGSQQPTVVTGAINGHDAILFDGVNDYLHRATFTGGVIAQPDTMYMIVKGDPSSADFDTYWSSGGVSDRQEIFELTGETYNVYAGGNLATIDTRLTTFSLIEVVYNSTSTSIYRDNVLLKTDNAGTNGQNGLTLGAAYSFAHDGNIEVAEFLIYDHETTTDENNDIIDYLEIKYDLGMNITGTYTAGSPAVEGSGNGTGWNAVQDNLDIQAQSSTALLVLVLIVFAAVVVVLVTRRLNN